MKMTNNRKTYTSPFLQRIELDFEISLVLASDISPTGEPDDGPWAVNTQQGATHNIFKNQLG